MNHDEAADCVREALNRYGSLPSLMIDAEVLRALLDGYQATGEAIQDAITRIEGHEPTSMVNAAYKTATLALLDTLLSKWRGPAPGRENP
jgi:C4-dicarboxylate-specific signal transduction histidine kinase